MIVLILKYTEEPYNLSLDVRKAFPGFEAGISSTLISLALFLQKHKRYVIFPLNNSAEGNLNFNSTSAQSHIKLEL